MPDSKLYLEEEEKYLINIQDLPPSEVCIYNIHTKNWAGAPGMLSQLVEEFTF